MALDVSAIATGLPMAASFAMAGGFVAFREGRRRTSLNAALHELRRPLQALSLSVSTPDGSGGPVEGTLEMAAAAVEQLDREINGRRDLTTAQRFPVRPFVEAAVSRWQPSAEVAERSLELAWSGDDGALEGRSIAFSQLLDNMISNALEHGTGSVVLAVEVAGGLCRLSVKDEGETTPLERSRSDLGGWISGRRRHGHGLEIVRRVAAEHRGRFTLVRSVAGTEAKVALPLSEGGR